MEILTSVKRLYISFKSLVNDFVYSFGRAALLLPVEVQNRTVPVRERGRIRVNYNHSFKDDKIIGLETSHSLSPFTQHFDLRWQQRILLQNPLNSFQIHHNSILPSREIYHSPHFTLQVRHCPVAQNKSDNHCPTSCRIQCCTTK